MSHDVGGDFISNVKDLSGLTVNKTGIGIPGWKWAVLALNSLQKSMAFTPLEPKAGPTGGAGAAWPAPTINLTKTFLVDMVNGGEMGELDFVENFEDVRVSG